MNGPHFFGHLVVTGNLAVCLVGTQGSSEIGPKKVQVLKSNVIRFT